jgi:DNA-binding CsgD family transcriptional regulator
VAHVQLSRLDIAPVSRFALATAPLAAGVAAFGMAETALIGDYHPRWAWVLAAAVTGALLLARRRRPLATVVALLVMLAILDYTTTTDADPGFPFFAVLIGCFSVGAYGTPRAIAAALVLVLADDALGIVVANEPLSDLPFVGFVVVGACALGWAVAQRNERVLRMAADREARAHAAVLEDRARIARELHDVVANTEIAARLIISEATAKTHVARILMKLGLRDRAQAVVFAYEAGVVRPGATTPDS